MIEKKQQDLETNRVPIAPTRTPGIEESRYAEDASLTPKMAPIVESATDINDVIPQNKATEPSEESAIPVIDEVRDDINMQYYTTIKSALENQIQTLSLEEGKREPVGQKIFEIINNSNAENFTPIASDVSKEEEPQTGTSQSSPLLTNTAIANGDSFSVTINEVLSKNGAAGILSNDLRVNNQYEIVITTTTGNGTLSIANDGALSYTPNLNYTGSDSFQYQLRHVNSGRMSEAVTVTIQVDPLSLSGNNDTLILGNITNIIETSDANFGADDIISGGTSTDTLNFSDAAKIATADLANKSGIDVIRLNANGNILHLNDAFVDSSDNDKIIIESQGYNLTLDVNDLNVARTVEIAGNGWVTLSSNGSGERITIQDGTNGRIIDNANDNTIIGGTGDDIFSITGSASHFGENDIFNGGDGQDRLDFFNTATITTTELNNKTGIDIIQFFDSNNDVTLSGAFVDASDNDSVSLDNNGHTITNLDISDVSDTHTVTILGTGQVNLATGGQRVTAGDDVSVNIIGNIGNDLVINGTSSDTITLGAGNDIFETSNNNFIRNDNFTGGTGNDTIRFTDATSISASAFDNKIGIDTLQFTANNNSLQLNDAFVDSSDSDTITIDNQIYTIINLDVTNLNAARTVVIGGTGTITLASGDQSVTTADGVNTDIIGGSGNDSIINGSGVDTITGQSGSDMIITTAANFVTADTFSGGTGTDVLRFTDAATITSAKLANKSGFEIIELQTNDNNIELTDAFVDASDTDTITIQTNGYSVTNLDVTSVDVARTVEIRGWGVTTLASGGQRVTSADGSNTIIINGSGIDTIIGGTGDDMVRTTDANFSAADTFNSGSGTDTLLFLDAATITTAELANKSSFEILELQANGNNIELTDTFVDASDTDTITIRTNGYSVTNLDVSSVDVARTVEINGWGVTTLASGGQRVTSADGSNTIIINGSGIDTIIGGTGNDMVRTTDTNFSAADTFNSGSGTDTLRFLDAATITAAELTNKSGFDILELQANGNSIELTDAFVDASDTDTITIKTNGYSVTNLDVSSVDVARTVEINGWGVITLASGGQRVTSSDGFNTHIINGNGTDTIIGGTGNNTIRTTEANFSAADTFSGGSGTDTLRFLDAATITTAELANKNGIDVIELNANATSIALNDAFVDASDHDILTLNNSWHTVSSLDTTDLDAARTVEIGGTGTVTLAAGGQTVHAANGIDVDIAGGSGNDTIYYSGGTSGTGSMDGNAGFDTLGSIDTSTLTLTGKAGSNFQGFEKVDISNGSQTLNLTAQDVLDMSDTTDTLFVYGGSNDAVTSTGEGWVAGGTTVATDGLTYQLYTSGSATLGVYTTDGMSLTLS